MSRIYTTNPLTFRRTYWFTPFALLTPFYIVDTDTGELAFFTTAETRDEWLCNYRADCLAADGDDNALDVYVVGGGTMKNLTDKEAVAQ